MRRTLPLFLIIGLLVLLVSLQAAYDNSAKAFVAAQKRAFVTFSEPLVPGTSALRLLSLNDAPLAADLLWINTIQYFGAGTPYGKYAALGPLVDRITQLDPKFEYPYEFGLVVLPFMDQTDTAIKLGQRAQTALPGNGLLTYYLATDYQLNKHDYVNAAKYYQLASKQQGAPGAALTLAGTSLDKINTNLADRLAAATFWKSVYDTAKTDDQKEQAKNWYLQLQSTYDLEAAALKYKELNGAFPATFQQMISAGLIKEVPPSPVKRVFELNPNTGKVSFDKLAN